MLYSCTRMETVGLKELTWRWWCVHLETRVVWKWFIHLLLCGATVKRAEQCGQVTV